MLRLSIAFVSFIGLVACGGNVVVDHGNGAGGSGGAGGSVASPASGTVVSSSSATSSSSAESSSVSASASTGTTMGCPADPHEDASCDIEGLTCPMANTCCGGGAICKGQRWHFTGALCNMPCRNCGPDDGFACDVNALCVSDELDVGVNYHCATNICSPSGSSCNACGNSICMNDHLSCADVKFPFVACDCPTC